MNEFLKWFLIVTGVYLAYSVITTIVAFMTDDFNWAPGWVGSLLLSMGVEVGYN